MIAPLASNRKGRRAYIEPGHVRSLSGYTGSTGTPRTKVTFVTGTAVHLEMPVEEVRAALDAERHEILRRGLARVKADRAAYEAEHPEWRPYFDLLDVVDTMLEAGYRCVNGEVGR